MNCCDRPPCQLCCALVPLPKPRTDAVRITYALRGRCTRCGGPRDRKRHGKKQHRQCSECRHHLRIKKQQQLARKRPTGTTP